QLGPLDHARPARRPLRRPALSHGGRPPPRDRPGIPRPHECHTMTPPRPPTSRRWVWGLLALAALAIPAWWLYQSVAPRAGNRQAGDGAAAAHPAAGQPLACLGYVDAEHGVIGLSPMQAGRVTQVFVGDNELVEEGAVLLRLDERPFRTRVEEAQAAVRAAQAQVEEALDLPQRHRFQLAQQQA